jgi:REP element-mobilizing transposase RayT
VAHTARPKLSGREPVLVTVKVRQGLTSLRVQRVLRAVSSALVQAKQRFGVRLVEYSVQREHVHLVAEAESKAALALAMKGLAVRLARAINRALARKGTVFSERYHERVLSSPRQVRHALAYVLCNGRKHGHAQASGWLDPCSSAASFDGWSRSLARASSAPGPKLAAPETWLLRIGWRRGGLIDPDHHPGREESAGRAAGA